MTDAELIQDSFTYLAPVMHEVTDRFYDRLFKAQPRLRALFPDEMKSQKEHFVAAVGAVVGHAHDLSAIEPTLRDMGARHVRYGATPELYDLICTQLVAAVAELALQESHGAWARESEQAWSRTLGAVAAAMLRGAADAKGTASA